jgi:hypothetical protein
MQGGPTRKSGGKSRRRKANAMDIDGPRFLHDNRRQDGAHSYFLNASSEAAEAVAAATGASLKHEAMHEDVIGQEDPGLGAGVKLDGPALNSALKEEAREESMQIG